MKSSKRLEPFMRVGLALLPVLMLSCSDQSNPDNTVDLQSISSGIISEYRYTTVNLVRYSDDRRALVFLTKGRDDVDWTSMFQFQWDGSDLSWAAVAFGFPYKPVADIGIDWEVFQYQVPPDLQPVELQLDQNQIAYAFRVVDGDKDDEENQYYALLKNDPDTIYAVSCQNFFEAFMGEEFDADTDTIPINQSVLDRLAQKEPTGGQFELKVISCNKSPDPEYPTIRLPVPAPAPVRPSPYERSRGEMWIVEHEFDDLYHNRWENLYFVQEDAQGRRRGYPLDCSDTDIMSAVFALGFTQEDIIRHPIDDEFDDTLPTDGETQLPISCDRDLYTMFKTDNEIPQASYYQTDDPKVLIEYTCPSTYRYFEKRATEVIRLPKEALPVTGLTPYESDITSALEEFSIIRIGCKNGPPNPSDDMVLFVPVMLEAI